MVKRIGVYKKKLKNMKKSYSIILEGEIQEKLEHVCSRGYYTYNGIIRHALRLFFEEIEKEKNNFN